MTRIDGRKPDDLRPVRIVAGYLPWAEGSALIEMGGTQVLCSASLEARQPAFLRGTGFGRAIEMGAGFGIGNSLINSIFGNL